MNRLGKASVVVRHLNWPDLQEREEQQKRKAESQRKGSAGDVKERKLDEGKS